MIIRWLMSLLFMGMLGNQVLAETIHLQCTYKDGSGSFLFDIDTSLSTVYDRLSGYSREATVSSNTIKFESDGYWTIDRNSGLANRNVYVYNRYEKKTYEVGSYTMKCDKVSGAKAF